MADRKISDLTALTTPASGDYLPIVDISETAASSKNKRITIEELFRGVPLGTAAAPSIAIEGDEDTGIYSPGANQVAISTSGTQRLTVDTAATTSTLPVVHPLGAVGTPSITFTGDLNTGLWSPTADTLAASTGGSERLRITSDGKVGLGTSSPGALFHAVNTSAGAATLGAFIQNADTTANTEVRLGFSPNSNVVSDNRYAYIGAINVLGSTDNALTFGTGFGAPATERMRIDSSGNVGVGTTSPSSLLHLADAGDITVGTTTGTKIGTGTTQKLGFWNATPVVQPAAVADATDAATVITQLNDLLAKLRTLGIIAT